MLKKFFAAALLASALMALPTSLGLIDPIPPCLPCDASVENQ